MQTLKFKTPLYMRHNVRKSIEVGRPKKTFYMNKCDKNKVNILMDIVGNKNIT